VHYTYLRELNDIFQHRGDAQILLSLATRSGLRYSEIAPAVVATTGDVLSGTEIGRCRSRLEVEGLLIVEGPKTHRSYRLTRRGREKAALLRYILDALERRNEDPRSDAAQKPRADPPPLRSGETDESDDTDMPG
jgi:DNA-binding PadR family transcriptional regulator